MLNFLKRKPDFTIGGDDVYMRRWYVIPRNRWFNIYLHNTLRDDDPTALHDHPWWNVSIVLRGGYFEVMPLDPMSGFDAAYWASTASQHNTAFIREAKAERYQALKCRAVWRRPGSIIFRRATDAHRLALANGMHAQQSWSLFITGPARRTWGFWCPSGWKSWQEYVKTTDGGNEKGAGCG